MYIPLLVGRSRALEIIVGSEDYNADTAEHERDAVYRVNMNRRVIYRTKALEGNYSEALPLYKKELRIDNPVEQKSIIRDER